MPKRKVIHEKLDSMSNADILVTWGALSQGWHSDELWDREHGITMDDWAEAVHSEKSGRGL